MAESLKNLKSLFWFLPVLLLLKINNALAQGSPGGGGSPGAKIEDPFAGQTITSLLEKVFSFLAALGGPILAIVITIGGFQILTAAGNPEKINTGKKTILYAAIGYLVILCAWGFLYIINDVLGVKIPK